jgi:hypothetical protein
MVQELLRHVVDGEHRDNLPLSQRKALPSTVASRRW